MERQNLQDLKNYVCYFEDSVLIRFVTTESFQQESNMKLLFLEDGLEW